MNREKKIIMTSGIGIGGNLLLVAGKMLVAFFTSSVSILMDAVNNLTDAMSSIITIIGTKLANKRPNKKHPFGYGRIEYLTSMIIGFLILFAGATAIYESIVSIVSYWRDDFPNGTLPVDFSIVSLILIGMGILIKLAIGLFFRIMSKKTDSEALAASGTDALWDCILSFGTLVGAFLAFQFHIYAEGYIGLLIGAFIVKAGLGTLKESLSHVVGERIDDKLAHQIKVDVCTVKGVKGAYDLIVNSYGMDKFIGSIHIEVADSLTAKEIQNIEREIQILAHEKYGIIMTVGIYASNENTPLSKEMKTFVRDMCKENANILQLHGFYVDEEKKFVNFDLVVSFDEQDPEALKNRIADAFKAKYPEFDLHINLDQDIAG